MHICASQATGGCSVCQCSFHFAVNGELKDCHYPADDTSLLLLLQSARARTHAHTHAHTRTLSHAHNKKKHAIGLAVFTHAHSLSLSLSHAHTHTLSLSLTHTHTPTYTHTLSLSVYPHSYPHFGTLLSHSYSPSIFLFALSLRLTPPQADLCSLIQGGLM